MNILNFQSISSLNKLKESSTKTRYHVISDYVHTPQENPPSYIPTRVPSRDHASSLVDWYQVGSWYVCKMGEKWAIIRTREEREILCCIIKTSGGGGTKT